MFISNNHDDFVLHLLKAAECIIFILKKGKRLFFMNYYSLMCNLVLDWRI